MAISWLGDALLLQTMVTYHQWRGINSVLYYIKIQENISSSVLQLKHKWLSRFLQPKCNRPAYYRSLRSFTQPKCGAESSDGILQIGDTWYDWFKGFKVNFLTLSHELCIAVCILMHFIIWTWYSSLWWPTAFQGLMQGPSSTRVGEMVCIWEFAHAVSHCWLALTCNVEMLWDKPKRNFKKQL